MKKVIVMILMWISLAPLVRAEPIALATGEWKPYTSKNMEGYGEFTREVSVVFEEMGHAPEYRFYPWARCFDSVVKGRVWAAFPYSYNKERAEKVWFSEPLSMSRTVFYYYEPPGTKQDFQVEKLSDLTRYRVGGVSGYFYEEIFRQAGVKIDYSNSEAHALEKMQLGRIDLIPINDRVADNLIKEKFFDRCKYFKTLDFILSENALCLIVSKTYPDSKQLLESFNAALQRARDKGMIQTQ